MAVYIGNTETDNNMKLKKFVTALAAPIANETNKTERVGDWISLMGQHSVYAQLL